MAQSLLLRALSTSLRPAIVSQLSRRRLKRSLSFVSAARTMASAVEPFQKVQIQYDDTSFDVYVIGKENAPGIVVVQEWWGVDYEVKNHAQKIADLAPGYRALIPDLYRGKVGLDVAEAQHLLDGLNWKNAVKDIGAAVKWLKANGSSKMASNAILLGPAHLWCFRIGDIATVHVVGLEKRVHFKVGVTGFCMGGALSIASAVLVPEVDAVVGFYGSPPADLADASKAQAPVQAHFGELDSFVGFSDVAAAKQLEEKLKASVVPYEVYIYPGVSHAFLNVSPEGKQRRKSMGMNDDDPDVVELAWSRFSSWMGKYLSA